MTISVYPEYKEGGVPWLGHVPEHWKVKRLKYVATLITRKSCIDEQAVALENIESWTARYLATDSEFDGDGVSFESGDILFGKLRPYLAKAWLAEFNGTAVGDFHVLRLRNVFDGRFACYLLLSQGYISLIDGSTFGAKMPRVSWEFMGNTVIPLPPFEEQRAIASFLDRKTAQIDELIAKKEALLKKLDEKRTAIITQAVTKGLDPSVPMKDSGVEWIGEIPEHWEEKRLKQTMLLITNKSSAKTQNIALENIESWSGRYIPSDTEFEGDGVTFQVGDILFGKLRPYLAKAYLAEFPGSAVGDFHVMRPITTIFHERYTLYLILNHGVISIIDGSTFGAKMPRVSWDFMGNIPLPVPHLDEQQAIAEHIEKKNAIIDSV
ncbi:MAG: restriction endonuclease subunit S [Chlorobium sp.]|uniref:restriction endonuclease subunit S n=1 Tax=Chlorobium sp. TaxID=1095 RepID=UPI0025B80483|nr:restriction endonuclease subunit S [Chlorobium sp.]MCF8217287.1 restriction endonuclease subunit S [Chlorobium sp.]MCF8272106.1 restriction endonuclease subunit S [Chlorobium sp.]MCF8288506.1 restriction endonuclease subunit S [Chlorobium sp.]MCF8386198.1 restriction endonuclease subunit S [Chlorobium sp.]